MSRQRTSRCHPKRLSPRTQAFVEHQGYDHDEKASLPAGSLCAMPKGRQLFRLNALHQRARARSSDSNSHGRGLSFFIRPIVPVFLHLHALTTTSWESPTVTTTLPTPNSAANTVSFNAMRSSSQNPDGFPCAKRSQCEVVRIRPLPTCLCDLHSEFLGETDLGRRR